VLLKVGQCPHFLLLKLFLIMLMLVAVEKPEAALLLKQVLALWVLLVVLGQVQCLGQKRVLGVLLSAV
jgi:hypothetical protein